LDAQYSFQREVSHVGLAQAVHESGRIKLSQTDTDSQKQELTAQLARGCSIQDSSCKSSGGHTIGAVSMGQLRRYRTIAYIVTDEDTVAGECRMGPCHKKDTSRVCLRTF
jgi:hypothetical protein